jgi:hypothetical protein
VNLRTGDQGADVGRVQQLLVEAGYGIDQAELAGSTFGHATYDAARQFQATHVSSDGHALYEDGVIGSETLWALMHGATSGRGSRYTAPGWRCSPSEARPEMVGVLSWAAGLIGTCEDPPGSNRGQLIDQWATSAGIEPGSPWCALFVSAAYHQLSIGSPFGWIASAYKFSEWGKQYRRVLGPGATLIAGDIFVILRANFHGHVGLVAGLTDEAKVYTIEGNSSDAVRGLVRDPASFACVLRPVPL